MNIKKIVKVALKAIVLSMMTLVALAVLFIILTTKVFKDEYSEYLESKQNKFFFENFDAFQRLEQMQREDISILTSVVIDENEVKIWHPDFKSPPKVVTNEIMPQRVEEYRRLLTKVGKEQLSYVWQEPGKRMVRFNNIGRLDSGYVYKEYPPPRFYESYVQCKPIMPSRSCYIRLAENWYGYSEKFRLKQY